MAQSREERNRVGRARCRITQAYRSANLAARKAAFRAQGLCSCGRQRARQKKKDGRPARLCDRCQRMSRHHGRTKRRSGKCLGCPVVLTDENRASPTHCRACYDRLAAESSTKTIFREKRPPGTTKVFTTVTDALRARLERFRLRYEMTGAVVLREALEEYLDDVESMETDADRMLESKPRVDAHKEQGLWTTHRAQRAARRRRRASSSRH